MRLTQLVGKGQINLLGNNKLQPAYRNQRPEADPEGMPWAIVLIGPHTGRLVFLDKAEDRERAEKVYPDLPIIDREEAEIMLELVEKSGLKAFGKAWRIKQELGIRLRRAEKPKLKKRPPAFRVPNFLQ